MATKHKPARKSTPEPADVDVLTSPTDEVSSAVVPASGLTAVITKAEFEQGVEIAHRYPRSNKKFLIEAREHILLDPETAGECIYTIMRANKPIRGASARFAEILGDTYTNCRAIGQVVEEGDEFVTGQGAFIDLQRNSGVRIDVKRRIVDRFGRRYNVDMIQQTGNAAVSIALRNAVLKGIPKGLWRPLYQVAERAIAGTAKTLAKRRRDMLEYLAKHHGVTEEQVLKRLKLVAVEDMSTEDLLDLHGLATAIKEGDLTPEAAFRPPQSRPVGLAGALEAMDEGPSGARESEPIEGEAEPKSSG